jgi:hypothetical protein
MQNAVRQRLVELGVSIFSEAREVSGTEDIIKNTPMGVFCMVAQVGARREEIIIELKAWSAFVKTQERTPVLT